MKIRIALLFLLSLSFTAASSAPKNMLESLSPQLRNADTPHEFEQAAKEIETMGKAFQEAIENSLNDLVTSKKIEQQIREHAKPEILVPQFIQEYTSYKSHQQKQGNSLKKANSIFEIASPLAESGGISGTVTVEGAPPTDDIIVLAFDLHGYFAGESEVNFADGSYGITGLPAGSYYVMTWSDHFIDELFDDVKAPLSSREAWQNATKVDVPNDVIVNGINFNLENGVLITGVINDQTGAPLAETQVQFIVTKSDLAVPLFEVLVETTTDGRYEITVPFFAGNIKIGAVAANYLLTWFPNQVDWAAAQVINIPNPDAAISNIDFQLQPQPGAAATGNISGSIRGGQVGIITLGLAAAFSATDTTLAGFSIGILGNYAIQNLPAGQYWVFGNDVLGNLMGATNYVGEFYPASYTLAGATLVQVNANQTTTNIDFALKLGGAIAGTVTNANGQPVDSILVVAANFELLEDAPEPVLTRLNLGGVNTDGSGRYKMDGMPAGKYVVRTVSTLPEALAEAFSFFGVNLNKHAGTVVDEYYKDVYNLLRIADADSVQVTVPNTTDNIDFQLAPAGLIRGNITDAVSGEQVDEVLVAALDDTSGYPFIPIATIDSSGFTIGPLPFGKYKIIALTGLDSRENYLTEFYDGARNFDDATVLQLNSPELTGINITLDRGGVIQGFVDLAPGASEVFAGADTLSGFPVLAYYADTGELASYDFVQFTGGYRIDKLLPGSYKVLVLPVISPFAATYAGGGKGFNDPASVAISLNFNQTVDMNIELNQANGSISGEIRNGSDNSVLSQVLVIAYEASGHPMGMGLTDYDLQYGIPTNPVGVYKIPNLYTGTYYLRTFAFSYLITEQGTLEGLLGLFGGGLDLEQLLGGNFDLFNLDFDVFQDVWYENVPATIKFDLSKFLLQFASYGFPSGYDEALFPVHLPLPFYEQIPAEATAVQVTDGAETTGINFILLPGELDQIFTDVPDFPGQLGNVPVRFEVYQNYPNPFNPETRISYYLPAAAEIRVDVYNTMGQKITTLYAGKQLSGMHQFLWNGLDESGTQVSSGIYFYRIEVLSANGTNVETKKMTLMK